MISSLKFNKNNFYISNVSIFIYLFLGIWIILIQSLLADSDFFKGLFVSDAISLTGTYSNFYSIEKFNIFDLEYTYWGLYYCYYLFDGYYWLVNLILIYFSFSLLNKIYFNIFGSCTNKIFFIIAFNPYNLLVINYINKEIVLQFLVLLFILYLFKKKFIPIFFISLTIFFIRDAYGVMLIGFYFYMYLFKKNLNFGLFIAFVLLYIAQIMIFQFSDFFLIQRNLNVTKDSFENATTMLNSAESSFYFIYKIVGNVVSLSLRPAFITSNDGIFVLGLGYYISGWIILLAYLINIYGYITIRNIDYRLKLIFYFQIFSLLLVSQSFFIMPRYLFPFIPIYLIFTIYVLNNHKFKFYNKLLYFLPIAITGIIVYLMYFDMHIIIPA